MRRRTGRGSPAETRARSCGFTLMEILIALPTLAIISLALVYGMIFASRTAHIVSNQVAAKNIAQGFFERMAIDEFENVTPSNYPSVPLASTQPLYLDHVRNTRCAVDIEITGYGIAETGNGTSITDNDASWEPGEWVGDTLFLCGGKGQGQRGTITANTANTLTVVPLTAGSTFDPVPDGTTEYAINGGKTVRITTRWIYTGKVHRATIESLVIDWGLRR